jgi:hypothetical protein
MTAAPTPPRKHGAAGTPTGANVSNAPALEMHLTVPSDGVLAGIAGELASKVVEFLGGEAGSLAATIETLTSRVAKSGEDVTFLFQHVGGELVIQARCNGRSSEVRHRL